MNKHEILKVLEYINADNVQEGERNIQCSCFLAPWRKGHSRGTDSRPSMGILIDPYGESKVHCFACEYGGSLKTAVDDLARFSGEDYSDLIRLVNDYEEIDPGIIVETLPEYDDFDGPKPEIILGESILEGIGGRAHKYVLNRGFELATLKEWESGYDSAYKRAVFPVRNISGQLVGAVGRTVNNHQIKYFNYFGFDKSRYVFGEHKVRPGTKLVVVEALLDTVKVWQRLNQEELLDEYSVVGLLGSEPSKEQCSKLVRLSSEVILFLDNDTSGQMGMNKLAKKLESSVYLKCIDYPENLGSDPDDLVENNVSLKDLFSAAKLLVAKRDNNWRKA